MHERVSITTRRYLDGKVTGALVQHADGRRHYLVPDIDGRWPLGDGSLGAALQSAAAELEASHSGMPAPMVDSIAWLALIAADRRVKRTALRTAAVIATTAPGQWIGLVGIGLRLTVQKGNVAKAIRRLVELGYVAKTREGQLALYRATMPETAL